MVLKVSIFECLILIRFNFQSPNVHRFPKLDLIYSCQTLVLSRMDWPFEYLILIYNY